MNFKPLKPIARASAGCRLGFCVRKGNGKGSGQLFISIHAELVRKLKAVEGQWLRLDADMTLRMGRLLPVNAPSPAARRMRLSGSGRGSFTIPYTGDVAEAFPVQAEMTDLADAEVSDEGLLFALPLPAARLGGKARTP